MKQIVLWDGPFHSGVITPDGPNAGFTCGPNRYERTEEKDPHGRRVFRYKGREIPITAETKIVITDGTSGNVSGE